MHLEYKRPIFFFFFLIQYKHIEVTTKKPVHGKRKNLLHSMTFLEPNVGIEVPLDEQKLQYLRQQ